MPEEARPRLVTADSPPPEAHPDRGSTRTPLGRAPWLLVGCLAVLLALSGGAWVLESRRAQELEGALVATRSALGSAQEAVRAHQSHLQDVRQAVAELDALVARDPVSD